MLASSLGAQHASACILGFSALPWPVSPSELVYTVVSTSLIKRQQGSYPAGGECPFIRLTHRIAGEDKFDRAVEEFVCTVSLPDSPYK